MPMPNFSVMILSEYENVYQNGFWPQLFGENEMGYKCTMNKNLTKNIETRKNNFCKIYIDISHEALVRKFMYIGIM